MTSDQCTNTSTGMLVLYIQYLWAPSNARNSSSNLREQDLLNSTLGWISRAEGLGIVVVCGSATAVAVGTTGLVGRRSGTLLLLVVCHCSKQRSIKEYLELNNLLEPTRDALSSWSTSYDCRWDD